MSVNANFYAMINELVARASSGTITGIVDYSTFIDAGKKIGDLAGTDFANAFNAALLNKIHLTLDTFRGYNDAYGDLVQGTMPANGAIEIITQTLYETREAAFVSLIDGQTVDQYEIAKPSDIVEYYTEDQAYQIPITIQRAELIGAFKSPETMDAYLRKKVGAVVNSNRVARENGRIGLVASSIIEAASTSQATDADEPSRHYNLLKLYNDITGAGLTTSNCLYNAEFVRFAVGQIKVVLEKIKKFSNSYNEAGAYTFTPEDKKERHIYVNSRFASAMEVYIRPEPGDRRSILLEDYVNVPYWQNEDTPLQVNDVDPLDDTKEITSPKTVAVVFDRFALMEYLVFEHMLATPLNARGEYYNNWMNVQTKFIKNKNANLVIFTIEDEPEE